MSKIRLIYFDATGRAEPIRIALSIGNIAFEDVRLSGQQFGEQKAAGNFKFGQLPVVEIDGVQYAQSTSILQWAGRQAGIAPTDSIQILRVDEALQLFQDYIAAVIPIWFNPDAAAKKEAVAAFQEGKGKQFLNFVENLLKNNGSNGWLVGNSITVADLVWANIAAAQTGFFGEQDPKYYEQFPLIQLHDKTVAEHQGVKAYYASKAK